MRLIVITGADACGKDTQIRLLEKYFLSQGKKVQSLGIWDSLQDFSNIADKAILTEVLQSFLLKFEAEARSLFLLSCLKNSMDKIRESSEVVLLNGYFYKYLASELSYGVDENFLKHHFGGFFPVPDRIIHICTPVEECLARRSDWSSYEQGKARTVGRKALDLRSFQQSVHAHLKRILSLQEAVETVNGSQNSESVFQEILGKI